MKLEFSDSSFRQLSNLPKPVQKRIVKKLEFYLAQENPIAYADKLTASEFGSFKFRIGDYRVLFDIHENTIFVLKVGHRKEIYR